MGHALVCGGPHEVRGPHVEDQMNVYQHILVSKDKLK